MVEQEVAKDAKKWGGEDRWEGCGRALREARERAVIAKRLQV